MIFICVIDNVLWTTHNPSERPYSACSKTDVVFYPLVFIDCLKLSIFVSWYCLLRLFESSTYCTVFGLNRIGIFPKYFSSMTFFGRKHCEKMWNCYIKAVSTFVTISYKANSHRLFFFVKKMKQSNSLSSVS